VNINLVFERSNPAMSRFLLTQLGFPFAKEGEGGRR
jgi:hypothetical protein